MASSTHRTRHTHATHSLVSDTSLQVVQSILGHASISTASVFLSTEEEATHESDRGILAFRPMPQTLIGATIGGGYDLGEGLKLSSLPEDAFDSAFDLNGPFEPNDRRLKDADTDQQKNCAAGIFLMRYSDPFAVGTPHDKDLGFGFVTANTGPFDARYELECRFSVTSLARG